MDDVCDADCIIAAVAHNEFKQLSLNKIKEFYKKGDDREKVFIDVKGIFKVNELEQSGLRYWRL